MKRAIGLIFGVVVALALGPLAGSASAQTSGSHSFRVIFAGPPSNVGRVVSTGVVQGAGTIVTPEGQPPTPFPAELIFPDGTLFLTVSPGAASVQFNPVACILSGTYVGQYEVDGGSNRYLGATGGGHFQGRVVLVFSRDAQGQCLGPDSPPISGVNTAENSGTLNIPDHSAGTIAFFGNRTGDPEVFVMNADGTDQTRLTFSPGTDAFPVISPNGRRIAWHSSRDGNAEIYVMNADATGATRLTNAPGDDTDADWSPNGRQIAFMSSRDGNQEIYVMNADGTGQTRLTASPGSDRNPDWSPSGKQILFNSDRDGQNEIYVMNADGTGQTRLTNSLGGDTSPAWSPDGSRIAFDSDRTGNFDIYVMKADGTGATRIAGTSANDADPVGSPDGPRIAFHSNRVGGGFQIFVTNAEGTAETQLTGPPGVNLGADWTAHTPPALQN